MTTFKSLKTIVSVSALSAIIALSSISSAHAYYDDFALDAPKNHQKMGKFHKKMKQRMIKALDLTEQQQAQIKAIRTQAKDDNQSTREALKAFKQEAKELVQAETFDEQAFTALQQSYQASFTEAGLAKAKSKHAIFNILTAEQQEKWQQIMEKRTKRFSKD